METLQVNGLKIAFRDEGEGEAVLLAHCSNGSSNVWKTLIDCLLRQGYRVLAPDFTGYGRSDPWPENKPFDPDADVNVLLALVERVGAPVHLVGHSYGGAIAIETARRLESELRSLTLIEPILFQFLREPRNRYWPMIERLGRRVRRAVVAGNNRKAASIFTRFWIGRVKWWLMPERNKRAIAQSMRKVVQEFEIIEKAHREPGHYALLTAPVRLILGTRTRAPARVVTHMLREVLPQAELLSVPAGHMSPLTHSDMVNDLVLEHVRRYSLQQTAA